MGNSNTTTVPRAGPLLAVLLTPLFLYQADATIVNVANPSIRSDLHASGAELQLIIGGYLLASAVLLITGARLGQLRGYRRMFLAGIGLFALASLAGGLAPNPTALIVARIVQGAGGALMLPQVLTGIQLTFRSGPERARALSLYSAALAGGAVIGQLLGGLLVSADLFGSQWRPIFLVNVPVALLVLIAGRRFLPGDREADAARRLDLPGVAMLSTGLLLIVLPLTLGRETHWPAWTWICLAASLPLLVAFVAVERRIAARRGAALVNLHVIARPAIAWGLWPYAIAVSTYYSLLFTLALYLQRGLGWSPVASGLALVPWVASFGIVGRLVGRVPRRLAALVAPAGCLLLAAAYAAIATTLLAGEHAAVLVALLAVGGVGLGASFSAILEHLTAAATPRYAADISGVFTTSAQIAGALGVAGFGTAYLTLAAHHGATHAFAMSTAAFALAALVAAALAYRATHLVAT
jgi:MFS family permease